MLITMSFVDCTSLMRLHASPSPNSMMLLNRIYDREEQASSVAEAKGDDADRRGKGGIGECDVSRFEYFDPLLTVRP
jgi:hypothetical protein